MAVAYPEQHSREGCHEAKLLSFSPNHAEIQIRVTPIRNSTWI